MNAVDWGVITMRAIATTSNTGGDNGGMFGCLSIMRACGCV